MNFLSLYNLHQSFSTMTSQPKFGASLQILKVEIGGDAQSTGECSVYVPRNLGIYTISRLHNASLEFSRLSEALP